MSRMLRLGHISEFLVFSAISAVRVPIKRVTPLAAAAVIAELLRLVPARVKSETRNIRVEPVEK